MHTTAKEAGQIAKTAEVKKLLIGHYSSRYEEVEPLLAEARSEFGNVEAAITGKIIEF